MCTARIHRKWRTAWRVGWLCCLNPYSILDRKFLSHNHEGAYSYEGLVRGKSMTGLNEDTTGLATFTEVARPVCTTEALTVLQVETDR